MTALLAVSPAAGQEAAERSGAEWNRLAMESLERYRAGQQQEELDRAVEAVQRALDSEDPTAHVMLVLEIARTLQQASRIEPSLHLLASARERFPSDHLYQVYLIHRQALAKVDAGDWESAQAFLQEAQARVEQGSLGEQVYWETQRYFVPLALEMGLAERAVALADEVVANLERLHDSGARVEGALAAAYVDQAGAYVTSDRHEAVLRLVPSKLQERAALFEARPSSRVSLLFNLALACAMLSYRDAELRPAAREKLEELCALASDPERTIRARCILARLDAIEGNHAAAEERLKEVRAAIARAGELSSYVRAGAIALEARIRRVCGATGEEMRVSMRDLEESAREVLSDLREEPLRPGGYGVFRYGPYREIFGELIEHHLALDERDGDVKALSVMMRCQEASSLARVLGARAADPETLRRELLDPGELALVYFPMLEGGHVFAFDREQLVHERTGPDLALLDDIHALQAALRLTPESEEGREQRAEALKRLGRKLAEEVFPGRVGELVDGARLLLIVGRDFLDDLPFEALLRSERALGLEKAIGYLPSLPAALHWQRRYAAEFPFEGRAVDFRLVAEAIHGERVRELYPELEEVRFGRSSLEDLARPFARRADVRFREDAVLSGLLQAPRTRVLMLLTHGVHDDRRELFRGLVLSPEPGHDGLFFAADVTETLAAPLVELAACSSGSGPSRQGDAEIGTLSGAFLQAGSLGVLSTSADARVEAIAPLWSAFHAELARGVKATEALRRARVALVAAGFDDPRDFVLVHALGFAHRPFFPPRKQHQSAARLAVALAVVVAGAAAWHRLHQRKRAS